MATLKLKDGFVFREIAGKTVIIPAWDGLNLDRMITLNETGMFLWKLLEQETDEIAVVAALLAEYEVEESVARYHVAAFINQLKEHDFLV